MKGKLPGEHAGKKVRTSAVARHCEAAHVGSNCSDEAAASALPACPACQNEQERSKPTVQILKVTMGAAKQPFRFTEPHLLVAVHHVHETIVVVVVERALGAVDRQLQVVWAEAVPLRVRVAEDASLQAAANQACFMSGLEQSCSNLHFFQAGVLNQP